MKEGRNVGKEEDMQSQSVVTCSEKTKIQQTETVVRITVLIH